MNWMALKSGSDVRGVALGDDAVLTAETAQRIGASFAQMLAKRIGKPEKEITVSIGRDSRITGEALLKATALGVALSGAQVLDFGLCTTPAMYMSTITDGFDVDGAIMITASHHPYHLNGIKLFERKGGFSGADIVKVLEGAEALDINVLPGGGSMMKISFLSTYTDQLAQFIRTGLQTEETHPLKGLHVVVDAGNGAGGFYAEMLSRLGASIRGSQFLDPDGMFPNHIPNPENEEAMASVCAAVKKAGADLGVIFDTDCDRMAIVDHQGREINRNRLIALVAAILLRDQKGQTIVTDSVTSAGLAQFITACGGKHHRFKRGYRNVIDEAIRLNNEGIECPLAIETSGHAAMKENHFLDDGMYLATFLIVEAMKLKRQGLMLSSLIDDLKEPVESKELRLKITGQDFRKAGQAAIELLAEYAQMQTGWHIAPDNHEGIRVSFDMEDGRDNGWFLLRLSVHDPVMPLNLESDIPGGIRRMLNELYTILKTMQDLDLKPILDALGTGGAE